MLFAVLAVNNGMQPLWLGG